MLTLIRSRLPRIPIELDHTYIVFTYSPPGQPRYVQEYIAQRIANRREVRASG